MAISILAPEEKVWLEKVFQEDLSHRKIGVLTRELDACIRRTQANTMGFDDQVKESRIHVLKEIRSISVGLGDWMACFLDMDTLPLANRQVLRTHFQQDQHQLQSVFSVEIRRQRDRALLNQIIQHSSSVFILEVVIDLMEDDVVQGVMNLPVNSWTPHCNQVHILSHPLCMAIVNKNLEAMRLLGSRGIQVREDQDLEQYSMNKIEWVEQVSNECTPLTQSKVMTYLALMETRWFAQPKAEEQSLYLQCWDYAQSQGWIRETEAARVALDALKIRWVHGNAIGANGRLHVDLNSTLWTMNSACSSFYALANLDGLPTKNPDRVEQALNAHREMILQIKTWLFQHKEELKCCSVIEREQLITEWRNGLYENQGFRTADYKNLADHQWVILKELSNIWSKEWDVFKEGQYLVGFIREVCLFGGLEDEAADQLYSQIENYVLNLESNTEIVSQNKIIKTRF